MFRDVMIDIDLRFRFNLWIASTPLDCLIAELAVPVGDRTFDERAMAVIGDDLAVLGDE